MLSHKQILEAFPKEARAFYKEHLALLRKKTGVLTEDIRKAVVEKEEASRKDSWFYEMRIEDRQKEYNNIIKEEKRIHWALNPKPDNENSITDADIEQAREVPITDFIEVNSAGFALCPFHEEHTPSFHYYKKNNRYCCFGCDSRGSVIDLVMKIHSLNFLDAVRMLIRK